MHLQQGWMLGFLVGATCVNAASRATLHTVDVLGDEVKNVAIIGAGAAGSSAAYHLQKYAEEASLAINITVFEKTDHIGGRTITVNPHDDPTVPSVELGASIFVKINKIMYEAAQEFNLPVESPSEGNPGDLTAIWDGEQFVYESIAGESFWWETVKLWWKYGTSPYYAMRLMKNTVGKFLMLYDEPWFPFRSLTQRCFELGLTRITGMTGEQWLAENGINAKFGTEIIQAATRVNYASNLAYIHGLEAMVSIATDGAVSVPGGNWQIFDRMVRRSGANLYANTSVASIQLHPDHNAKAPKYTISTKGTDQVAAEAFPITFDNVVIASPWQFSNITADGEVFKHTIDDIPYTKLHVTIFTSPFQLRPAFFNLEPGTKPPKTVYTTLNEREEPKKGPAGVGMTGFYSISTLRTIVNPETSKKEYVYKIFSAEAVTAKFLTDILGVEVPSTFTSPTARTETEEEPAPAGVKAISWYSPHWFYSYPVELPRVTFQDPILGSGLYYTSGMESFISTMETSALMGMNVAKLIANDFSASMAKEFTQKDRQRPVAANHEKGDFFESMENSFFGGVDGEL